MNKKLIPITAIALVAVGVMGVSMYSLDNSLNLANIGNKWVATDPSEFTNADYNGFMHAQYTTTDPFKIKQSSDFMILGTISAIEQSEEWTGNSDPNVIDEDGELRKPTLDATYYTVDITKVVKGDYQQDQIIVKSIISSKIGYDIGDNAVLFVDEMSGDYVLNAGPHSMFKDKDGKAIGHEKTLPVAVLLNAKN